MSELRPEVYRPRTLILDRFLDKGLEVLDRFLCLFGIFAGLVHHLVGQFLDIGGHLSRLVRCAGQATLQAR